MTVIYRFNLEQQSGLQTSDLTKIEYIPCLYSIKKNNKQ